MVITQDEIDKIEKLIDIISVAIVDLEPAMEYVDEDDPVTEIESALDGICRILGIEREDDDDDDDDDEAEEETIVE